MATATRIPTGAYMLGVPVTLGDGTVAYAMAEVATDTSGNPNQGSSTATVTPKAASTSAITLLAANTARKGATVYYDGASVLYLLEGSGTPSSTNYTTKLGQGLYTQYEAPQGFTGALQGIWTSAVGTANVTERTA
jgi:hypothetical protein